MNNKIQPDYSNRFLRSYNKAPSKIKKKLGKQLRFLLENIHHPSLQIKKYSGTKDILQGRIDKSWRFYFIITDNTYYFLDIIDHPK